MPDPKLQSIATATEAIDDAQKPWWALLNPKPGAERGSLVRRVARELTPERCIDLYRSGSHALISIAHNYLLKHINDPAMQSHLITTLSNPDRDTGRAIPLILTSLLALPLPHLPTLASALVTLATSSDVVLAERAARVISTRYPALVPRITSSLQQIGTRRGLCFSDQADLLPKLISAWGVSNVRQQPPVLLGTLITPQALSELWRSDSETGLALARCFGYVDDQDNPALTSPLSIREERLIDLLEHGFMTVDPCMQNISVDEAHRIESAFVWALLPWSTGTHRPVPADINIENPLHRTLFFCAVRATDRANLRNSADDNPYSESRHEHPPEVIFSRAPISTLKRKLITQPTLDFQRLGGNQSMLTQYLVENANCLLQVDFFQREEQRSFLDARWRLASKLNRKPPQEWLYPERDGAQSTVFRTLVPSPTSSETGSMPRPLQHRADHLTSNYDGVISAGAKSARLLLEHLNRGELGAELAQIETIHSRFLPSIGVEVQRVLELEQRHLMMPWKHTLRYFHIPSPRLPERFDRIEASFAPAHSYNSHIVAILLLRELGFFQTNKDMALHISIGGDMGENVRYLLFAQQFIAPPTNQPIGPKLMSKGFAHLHRDAVPPNPLETRSMPLLRTELRSMRINAQEIQQRGFSGWIDDIITLHLLAGASLSELPSLSRIWGEFTLEVTEKAQSLGREFEDLLRADWYESSGDASDRILAGLLDIGEKRRKVFQITRDAENESALRESFTSIRNRYARRVFDEISPNSVDTLGQPLRPELFTTAAAGIPFLNPYIRE